LLFTDVYGINSFSTNNYAFFSPFLSMMGSHELSSKVSTHSPIFKPSDSFVSWRSSRKRRIHSQKPQSLFFSKGMKTNLLFNNKQNMNATLWRKMNG
jgi:hypothetical protein